MLRTGTAQWRVARDAGGGAGAGLSVGVGVGVPSPGITQHSVLRRSFRSGLSPDSEARVDQAIRALAVFRLVTG
jgi:hypothetical protein